MNLSILKESDKIIDSICLAMPKVISIKNIKKTHSI
jgi:hypothetical protein